MCCIYVAEKLLPMHLPVIRAMADTNPDGFGVLVYHENAWQRLRTMSKEKALAFVSKFEGRKVIFHARIATAGSLCIKNCHPFDVGDGYFFAHNGVMFGVNDKDESDTLQCAKAMKRLAGAITNKDSREMYLNHLEKQYPGNRFVLALPNGSFKLWGSWTKSGGAWYSNTRFISCLSSKEKSQNGFPFEIGPMTFGKVKAYRKPVPGHTTKIVIGPEGTPNRTRLSV